MKNTLTHPLTKTRYDVPLYVSPSGRKFYPIGGAAEDGGGDGGGDKGGEGGDKGGSGGDGGDNIGGKGDEDQLGDAGKKAIAEEREARKAEKRRADAAEKELEKLRNKDKSADEKALDEAKKAGKAEAEEANNTRLINAELRALAAEAKMRDPRDAVAQLRDDLEDIKVDDGEVDSAGLTKLLTDLKKDKPYLFDDGKDAGTHQDAGIGGTGGGAAPEVAAGRARIKSAIDAASKKK